jgi:hypothetical protein
MHAYQGRTARWRTLKVRGSSPVITKLAPAPSRGPAACSSLAEVRTVVLRIVAFDCTQLVCARAGANFAYEPRTVCAGECGRQAFLLYNMLEFCSSKD